MTIVAIGGLLYPALRKQGYPHEYALGLVTTGGSLGLLLGVTVQLGRGALVDWPTVALAFIAGAALFRWRTNPTWLIFGGAGVGWLLHRAA